MNEMHTENLQDPMPQNEDDSEPQNEGQNQDKPDDSSNTGHESSASESTITANDQIGHHWHWYRWVALLVGTILVAAATTIVITILVDDEDSGDRNIAARLNECDAILTFGVRGGPHSVMICPGTADAYVDFDDLAKFIDEFLSMDMDAEDEMAGLPTELFDDMEITPEMADRLSGFADMFGFTDILEDWTDDDEWDHDNDEDGTEAWNRRKQKRRGFNGFERPIPDMPKKWKRPRIPHGPKDADGWGYRMQCPDFNPDTPEKCETWFWDGKDRNNAKSDETNSQNWPEDGRFEFDEDVFEFFFDHNLSGLDSLLELVRPEEKPEESEEPEETEKPEESEESEEPEETSREQATA